MPANKATTTSEHDQRKGAPVDCQEDQKLRWKARSRVRRHHRGLHWVWFKQVSNGAAYVTMSCPSINFVWLTIVVACIVQSIPSHLITSSCFLLILYHKWARVKPGCIPASWWWLYHYLFHYNMKNMSDNFIEHIKKEERFVYSQTDTTNVLFTMRSLPGVGWWSLCTSAEKRHEFFHELALSFCFYVTIKFALFSRVILKRCNS